jgi:hypothetical protein
MKMSDVDGIWQSDQLIPNHIKESLIIYVNSLENISKK